MWVSMCVCVTEFARTENLISKTRLIDCVWCYLEKKLKRTVKETVEIIQTTFSCRLIGLTTTYLLFTLIQRFGPQNNDQKSNDGSHVGSPSGMVA